MKSLKLILLLNLGMLFLSSTNEQKNYWGNWEGKNEHQQMLGINFTPEGQVYYQRMIGGKPARKVESFKYTEVLSAESNHFWLNLTTENKDSAVSFLSGEVNTDKQMLSLNEYHHESDRSAQKNGSSIVFRRKN